MMGEHPGVSPFFGAFPRSCPRFVFRRFPRALSDVPARDFPRFLSPALPLFPHAFSPRGDVLPSDMTTSLPRPRPRPAGPLCFLCAPAPCRAADLNAKAPACFLRPPVGSGPSLRFPLSRIGKARFAGEMSFSPIKNIDKSANTMESCLVPKGVPRHSEDGGPDGRVLLTARLFCA